MQRSLAGHPFDTSKRTGTPCPFNVGGRADRGVHRRGRGEGRRRMRRAVFVTIIAAIAIALATDGTKISGQDRHVSFSAASRFRRRLTED